ncbi:hypothetical protein GCM10023198_37820 [Promicromonospora umidemergens]|uniref:Uncharacterized protein n=1 Tax=Promicromonospora umidemergens TaxID=629679 RepID=A0ABP8XRL7_9MICO
MCIPGLTASARAAARPAAPPAPGPALGPAPAPVPGPARTAQPVARLGPAAPDVSEPETWSAPRVTVMEGRA